jgi:hypothetical protein
MQRPGAKIAARDRKCPQRQKGRNETVENPRRSGPFPIDDGFFGLGGLDGGVRSHMRTRLRGNSLLTGKLTGNFANSGLQARKLDEIVADNQLLVAKFPKKHNREFFRSNRELRIDNREFGVRSVGGARRVNYDQL